MSEFCLLVQRLNDQAKRNPDKVGRDGNIRRQAGDDWY